MISKVFSGHSFYGSIRYVCQELKHAEIMKVEGVRVHDIQLMIEDFVRQHQLRPEKKQACFHSILSFYPGEKPTDKTIVEIAEKYLQQLNITDTQFAIIKHTDKAHLHVHIIANMVNNKGKSIKDNWIALKGKKVAQRLTLEYNLIPALSKKLELTHKQNFREPEQHLYKIYEAIGSNLKHCTSLDQLQQRLLRLGIEIQYKYKGQTLEKQGVSFKLGKYCFKGSKIDRKFSLLNLERALALRQKQETKSITDAMQYWNFNQSPLSYHREQHTNLASEVIKGLGYALSKNIEVLLTPSFIPDQLSGEWLHEAKKKRKRQSFSR